MDFIFATVKQLSLSETITAPLLVWIQISLRQGRVRIMEGNVVLTLTFDIIMLAGQARLVGCWCAPNHVGSVEGLPRL